MQKILDGIENVPLSTSWYLADIGQAIGKQEMFTHQMPEKLRNLRENAVIESAVSSNRIEGVEINQSRIGTVIFGKTILNNRDEEEIRGYRQALELIHSSRRNLAVSEENIKQLHRLSRANAWDGGIYKEKQGDIIEKYSDGTQRVRFETVSVEQTPHYMGELVKLWNQCCVQNPIHSLIVSAAFNLDFLCIHPFRDGNGRVSRLLLLLQSYYSGCEVGRYVSLEKLIENNKERYYETLEESSFNWHQGQHNMWPYVNYMLWIFKQAYDLFESRVTTNGFSFSKTDMIKSVIEKNQSTFSVAEIKNQCPDVSVDLIRKALKSLQAEGKVECISSGRSARWRKLGNLIG